MDRKHRVILQIGAETAIDAFDGAVQYVNRERSRMGAYKSSKR